MKVSDVADIDRSETVGHLCCAVCDTECGRFPYMLKFTRWEKPQVVCKQCFRTALCLEYLIKWGTLEIKDSPTPPVKTV